MYILLENYTNPLKSEKIIKVILWECKIMAFEPKSFWQRVRSACTVKNVVKSFLHFPLTKCDNLAIPIKPTFPMKTFKWKRRKKNLHVEAISENSSSIFSFKRNSTVLLSLLPILQIQRFEFTFPQTWKCIRSHSKAHNISNPHNQIDNILVH